MKVLIFTIGIMLIAAGAAFFVKPDFVKKIINFAKKGSIVYYAAVLRIIISVIFFVGSHACRIQWAIITLGVIFLLSGILVFVANITDIRKLLDWISSQSEVFHRLLGLVPLTIGIIIVFCT